MQVDKIKTNLDPINEQKLNLKDKIDLKNNFQNTSQQQFTLVITQI